MAPWVRRTRNSLISISILLLILGLAGTLFWQLLLPGWLPDIRERVAVEASQALEQPVDIGNLTLQWGLRGPELLLHDVTLQPPPSNASAKHSALYLTQMRLGLRLRDIITQNWQPQRIHIDGLRFVIQQNRQGQINIRGLRTRDTPQAALIQRVLQWLASDGELLLNQADILWQRETATGWAPVQPSQIDIRVKAKGENYQAEFAGQLPADIGNAVIAQVHGRSTGEQAQFTAQVAIKAQGLRLDSPWLRGVLDKFVHVQTGRADIQVKFDWQDQTPQRAHGQLAVRDIALADFQNSLQTAARYPTINSQFDWQSVANGWQLQLHNTTIHAPQYPIVPLALNLRWQRQADQTTTLEGDLDQLPLAPLQPLLQAIAPLNPLADILSSATQPQGTLKQLQWQFTQPPDAPMAYTIQGQAEALALKPHNSLPGFNGVHGKFAVTPVGGEVELRSDNMQLAVPNVYPAPLTLQNVRLPIRWQRQDTQWQVDIENIRANIFNAQLAGRAGIAIIDEQAKPELDLALTLTGLDFPTVRDNLPSVIPVYGRNWLERALKTGQITQAKIRFQGQPGRFGTNNQFNAQLQINDGALRFHPAWPRLEKLRGELHFHNYSMRIAAKHVEIAGASSQNLTAQIENLLNGNINIKADMRASAAALLDIAANSPLKSELGRMVKGVKGSGEASLNLQLSIPVLAPTTASAEGHLRFKQVDFVRTEREALRHINGKLKFIRTEAGVKVTATQIPAEFMQLPIDLKLDIDTAKNRKNIFASGLLDLSKPPQRQTLNTLLPSIIHQGVSGKARWTADVSAGANHDVAERVIIRSNLKGVTTTFPNYGKAAATPWPLQVHLDRRKTTGIGVHIHVPDNIDGRFWLQNRAGDYVFQRGQLFLGDGRATLPKEPGLSVQANVERYSIDQLRAYLNRVDTGASDDTAKVLNHAYIKAKKVRSFGLDWTNAIWQAKYRNQGAVPGWEFSLDADQVQGTVLQPKRAGEPLQVNFSRLQLGKLPSVDNDQTPQKDGRQPTMWSPMDINIAQLAYKNVPLGELQAKLRPALGSLFLTQLELQGEALHVTGSGRWDQHAGGNRSQLKLQASTENLRQLLDQVGYSETVSAEKASANLQLSWPAAITDFKLSQATGDLSLALDNGKLHPIDPGLGRIFGLLSFNTLPRRLLLNFKDIVEPGLEFEDIRGDFVLEGGSAHTKNLRIKAPGLSIHVIGRTGLITRDYDQRVTITPELSSGVALAGAALSTAGIGLVILLGQEILGQPLDQLGKIRYRVYGNWENPQVEKLGTLFKTTPAAPNTPTSKQTPTRATGPRR